MSGNIGLFFIISIYFLICESVTLQVPCVSIISRDHCECVLSDTKRTEKCTGDIGRLLTEIVLQDITDLHIKGATELTVPHEFNRTFQNLRTFDIADSGYISKLPRHLFRKFPNMRTLRLHNCSITDIEQGAFGDLPELISITLSGNSLLKFDDISGGLDGMNSSRLEVFNISGVHNAEDIKHGAIKTDMFLNLNHTSLKVMDISWTRLSYIQASFHLISTIETLNMSGTNLFGESECLSSLAFLPNIRTFVLDVWPYSPRGNDQLPVLPLPRIKRLANDKPTCIPANITDENNCFIMPTKLIHIQVRKMNFNALYLNAGVDTICYAKNNVEFFSMSYYESYQTIGQMAGFHSLKTIDLSFPAVLHTDKMFHPAMFTDMSSLEQIFLVQTRLDRFSLDELEHLVDNNKYLKIIDMSGNELKTLPDNMFKNNEILEYIFLTNNKLKDFKIDLSRHANLIKVDLRFNLFKEIDSAMLYPNSYHIDLRDNDIPCECRYLIVYDSNIRTTFNCTLGGISIEINHARKSEVRLSDMCKQIYEVILIGFIGLLIYIVFVSFTAFIIWRFRICRRNKGTKFTRPFNTDETISHLAFIAYSHADTDVVVRCIYRPLLAKLSEVLKEKEEFIENKFLLYDKDFMVGANIDDVCEHAVKQSRVAIVIISEHSLSSAWCRIEVRHAERFGRDLIPIFLTSYDPEKLTGEFKILCEKVRLCWPKDSNAAEVEEIIDTLCRSLLEIWTKKASNKRSTKKESKY